MLTKLLTEEHRKYLLKIAELLSLSDRPLLWDGKTKEEITGETDIKKLSIQKDEQGSKDISDFWLGRSSSVEHDLLEKLKALPLHVIENPERRAEAALAVLRDLLKEGGVLLPSVSKLILFELMRLALSSGQISSIQWQLLNEFKHHYRLEDFIFQELLERAESMCRETQKTIALILE